MGCRLAMQFYLLAGGDHYSKLLVDIPLHNTAHPRDDSTDDGFT